MKINFNHIIDGIMIGTATAFILGAAFIVLALKQAERFRRSNQISKLSDIENIPGGGPWLYRWLYRLTLKAKEAQAEESARPPRRISRLPGRIFRLSFAGFGIFMMIKVASLIFAHSSALADGTVVAFVGRHDARRDTTYYFPRVSFTSDDGRAYDFVSYAHYPAGDPVSGHVGEKVRVLYSPDDPRDASMSRIAPLRFYLAKLGVFLAFGGFCSIFIFVGTINYLSSLRRSRLRDRLMEYGRIIEATVQAVEIDTSTLDRPYVILARWLDPASSTAHVFKSEPIWADPSLHVKRGDRIKVTIEPNNPAKYFVDTSFLPVL